MDFDLTRPEEMARIVSRDLRASGAAFAEAKRRAEEAKNIARREPKLVAIAVRKREIDIGEKPTEQAVKDFAATCPQAELAEEMERWGYERT